MSIRPATPDDVGAIEAVVHDAYLPYVERIGREPAPMTVDYRSLVAHSDHVHVLAEASGVVGVLVLIPERDHLLVENVAVAQAARGMGYGRALMVFAEQYAYALGFMQVRLYTNAAMTENLAFYPRLGYVEVGRAVEDGFARVYFVKELVSDPGPGSVIP